MNVRVPRVAGFLVLGLGVVAGAAGLATRGNDAPARGEYAVAFDAESLSLDPALANDEQSIAVSRLVFEQLLTFDRAGKLIPLLATEVPPLDAAASTYTFTLRPGIAFVRGDGSRVRDVVAEDVVRSFERLLDPALAPRPSPASGKFFTSLVGVADYVAGRAATIAGIRVTGERQVEFRLDAPDPTFLMQLATPYASVVPVELGGRDTTAFAAAPVGTGPFLLASAAERPPIRFARNPHYWQAEPRASGIEVRLGIDSSLAVEQVQAGTLDLAGSGIPPGLFASLVADPRWQPQVRRAAVLEVQYLSIDAASDSPLADERVRRAIAHALDRENVIRIVQGRGVVARCLFPPGLAEHDEDCETLPRDLDLARRLMAEAGQGAGFATKIFVYNGDPDPLIGESIQHDLAEIGIRVEVVAEEFATWIKSIETPGRAPLAYIGWSADYPDAASFIDPILTCGAVPPAGSNFGRYCDAEVDRLAAEARLETDPQRRVERYRALELRILEAAPVVPLRHPVRATLVSERMTDVYLHPVWLYDLRNYTVGS